MECSHPKELPQLIERYIIPSIGRVALDKLKVRRIEGFYKALAEKVLGA